MKENNKGIMQNGALLLIAAVVLLAALVWTVGTIQERNIENNAFDFTNFTNRAVLAVTDNTSHGEISVGHIEFISDNLYNRVAFSRQELFTARWIVEELLSMGYTLDDIEVQEFTLDASRDNYLSEYMEILPDTGISIVDIFFFVDEMPFVNMNLRSSQLSQNIILTVPGQSQCDTFIVVGAHYDSVMYPGASDNASGMALLLESAQRMRYLDNYYTIIYAFFGAEEVGILGAFYYVSTFSQENHDNLLFMVNADVLLEGPDLFYMAGYYDGIDEYMPAANHITEAWDEIAKRVSIENDIDLIAFPPGAFAPSDQLAFIYSYHTVINLAGLRTMPGWYDMHITYAFFNMVTVLHSPQDNFQYINQTWPGMIETNMRGFSIFLEELLLASY